MVSISDWTTYSNSRAILSNAGNPSHIYPDFKPFSPNEVRQFIGLYILQGLSPSPQVKLKFRPHHEDYVNGSDLCFQVFGRKGERRHKHFKTFFAVQDPLKIVPPKVTHPNWKVDPFLAWIQDVSMAAWDLGQEFSCDEQTIGFKGNHQDKQRISYKKEGDGFLADAISEDGYTYSFYFRNMPAPKKYVSRKFSPLHSRVLFLFDQLKQGNHICGLDNLYNSTKFAREAYVGKNCVMVHGVTRKSGRGLPSCVLQKELKNQKDAEKVRGTTKAAVLEGDERCPNLVAFSVYDTKPVHFLSMSCTSLKWVEKVKVVFDKKTEKRVQMRFLRCKVNDDYNNGMNGVDIADQLRGSYRIDRWMHKRKWWWAIWMWGVQLLLVNAYVLYRTAHLYMWKKKKKSIMSHYEFRRQIALTWLLSGSDPSCQGTKRARTVSANDSECASSYSKSKKVSDASLDPNNGSLCIRLDDDQHFPVIPTSKRPCCSLCRWVEQEKDIKNRSGIVVCDKCQVSLCIDCFKPFHTVSSVSKLRSEVIKNKLHANGKK
jgi:Transposase IS4